MHRPTPDMSISCLSCDIDAHSECILRVYEDVYGPSTQWKTCECGIVFGANDKLIKTCVCGSLLQKGQIMARIQYLNESLRSHASNRERVRTWGSVHAYYSSKHLGDGQQTIQDWHGLGASFMVYQQAQSKRITTVYILRLRLPSGVRCNILP